MKGLETSFRKNIIAWAKHFKIYESIQNIMWIMKKKKSPKHWLNAKHQKPMKHWVGLWNIFSIETEIRWKIPEVFETSFHVWNKNLIKNLIKHKNIESDEIWGNGKTFEVCETWCIVERSTWVETSKCDKTWCKDETLLLKNIGEKNSFIGETYWLKKYWDIAKHGML
jgi:hypothetical protein